MRRSTTRPERTAVRLAAALALIAGLLAAPACGRKGVPQPPVKVRPLGSPGLTSTQNGNTINVSWRLPEQNTDQSDLVGISRVELFRYTELLEPKKEDEDEDEGRVPMNYDVLDQVTQSFLAESAEEESMYGAGYGTGAMTGMDDTFAGKFGGGGGGRDGSNTGTLGGSSRSDSSSRDDGRDGWAESQQQRPPRVTPGFRGESGKFISGRKFEKRADLLLTLTGAEIQGREDARRLYHADPLPGLDEETRELTRYHYAVRVTDTLGREGLFSDFLKVTPLEPPPPPRNLAAKSLETSIDLSWDGPPVDPWVRIAREAELAALEALEGETAAGAPVHPGRGNAPGGKTAAGRSAKSRKVGGKMAAASGQGSAKPAGAGEAEEELPQPPEDAVVPGWIIQPPATFGPGSRPRLLPLLPYPWPVGPRRPVPPFIAGYYVFRQLAEDEGPPDVPRHPQPLIERTWSDPRFTFGETYRYVVRTVMVTEDGRVESESSEPVVIVAVDTYPPITPVNFTYVAANGEVTLIWTPNGEPDLRGYNVYRREGTASAEGAFVQLNDEPIEEPRYRDATVRPGSWYSYRVDAVDDSEPANRSEPSEPLEVMAR